MSAVRSLVLAQVSFFGWLLVAVAVTDDAFTNNHGLSYYGEHLRTFVPYGIGTVTCAFFLWRAAPLLPGLGTALRAMVALLLVDLVSPPTAGSVLYWTHVASGTLLFLVELGIAGALAARTRAAGVAVLAAAQLGAGLVAALSQLQVLALLSWGILLYQLAFGALLVAAVRDLEGDERVTAPAWS